MARASTTPEPEDRANELYWGSDQSVNQIAEELDLSKGAFYGMIRPLAAGFGCPACGREVAHTNRTAKERGEVDCPACGWQGAEDETLPEYIAPGPRRARPKSAASGAARIWSPLPLPAPGSGATRARLMTAWADVPLSRTLTTGALIGGAVGLGLVLWARRR